MLGQFISRIARVSPMGSTLGNAVTSQAGLGVLGLPAGVGVCRAGRISVLLVRDESLARSCAHSSAQNFRQAGQLAILASGGAGRQFMDQVAAVADHKLDQGLCNSAVFFRISDDCIEGMGRQGAKRFFAELEALGVSTRHASLIFGAQAIFDWQNYDLLIRQWQAWKSWAAARRAPVLLVIVDVNGAQGYLPLLQALPNPVPDLAVLDSNHGSGLLTIERWFGQDGDVHRQFGLKPQEAGKPLTADGSEMDATGRLVLSAPDQGRVIASAAALNGVKGVPAEWQLVNDLADMDAACTEAVAATVLLHADGDHEFEALSHLVHRLRLTHPRALKIIVREAGNKLRYNNELVLLRLGANMVVYKEIPFSRLLRDIQDMAQQSFARPVEDEYLLALQAAEPNRVSGYLAPALFCREVSAMLKRSERISLGHSLVVLPILSRVAHLDALLACRASRFGDVFTADQGCVYLFLFACREPDVDASLDRFFSVPVTELFSSHIVNPTAELIEEAVGRLRRGNESSPAPDYSHMLPKPDDKFEASGASIEFRHDAEPPLPAELPDASLLTPARVVFKPRFVTSSPLPLRAETSNPQRLNSGSTRSVP